MKSGEYVNGIGEQGFVLVAVLFMLTVLSALLASYLVIGRIELATYKASKDGVTGFYASEAGLNLRAEEIRTTFVDYNTPSGTSPSSSTPCEGSDVGSGSFACQSKTISNRTVSTYVIDHQNGGDPPMIKIPQGELYQNLNAQEYSYTANSEAVGPDGKTEAILQLRFKSRLVPLFQFAAFYNKDLEILPGPTMVLSGPVHTNGDLYLNSNATLSINGQVTGGDSIYRGRKDGTNTPICTSNSVLVKDPINYLQLYPACTSRHLITESEVQPFNGMIQFNVQEVTVPEPDVLDSESGQLYWDKADLRIVLQLDANNNPDRSVVTSGVLVWNSDESVDVAASTTLFACTGSISRNPYPGGGYGADNVKVAAGSDFDFRNNRELKTMRLLNVDLQALLNCLKSSNWFGSGKSLADDSEGGLVIFFTVKGPNSLDAANTYGVRVRNGAEIASNVNGAPLVKGLTTVSDQGFYLQGDFNTINKKPAAVLADTFNVLSNAWWDGADFRDTWSTAGRLDARIATNTTQNLAILAGTDTTGGIEGSGGQGGAYNGGLENYPRFHEYWTGKTFTYRGSFVSLNVPRHVNGVWRYGSGSAVPPNNLATYTAPNRNWDYDTSFNNAANLPPITPRFVYLRQELFVRDFEQ